MNEASDLEKFVKTSISLKPEVLENGKKIAKLRGFGYSFSAYLAWLIERDASGSVERERVEDVLRLAADDVLRAAEEPPPLKGGAKDGAPARKK